MVVRAGAAALLAMTLILAAIVLAAHPAGRTSRTATRVLCAIPVASATLSVVAVVSGSPDVMAFILLLSCTAVSLAMTRAAACPPAHEGGTRQPAPRPPELAAAAPHATRIIPASSGRSRPNSSRSTRSLRPAAGVTEPVIDDWTAWSASSIAG